MILRRFMKHVKEQNWFAVGLDVIVVIVGIFLGLQVQNWYEARQDNVQERAYLERLHGEIENMELSLQQLERQSTQFIDNLIEFSQAISSIAPETQLGEEYCQAAAGSHIMLIVSANLPTMTELVSSGQLSILSDPGLRVAIADYLIDEEKGQRNMAQISNDRLELARKYPDLIYYEYGDKERFRTFTKPICDFDAIRESRAFGSDLLSNARRTYAVAETQLNRLKYVKAIHSRIDQILGLAHEEKTP